MIYTGFITCKDTAEARKIVQKLLQKKLIACGNIIPAIESHFWWEGKIDTSNEVLLLVKTVEKNVNKVIQETTKLHSYDLPAIEFIQVAKAEDKLANWIKKSTE